MSPEPVLPDYAGACVANVVPEVIKHLVGQGGADWLPEPVKAARQVVLLVIDGLGWEQLQAHKDMAPTLTSFSGDKITTVAPSTTATVLTSIVTGRPPAVTGMVGYRMMVGTHVLNALKWTTEEGNAYETIPPAQFQTQPAFAANEIPAVVRRSFIGTGFTDAHMQGAKQVGYSAPSSIPVEVWRLLKEGEQFVYAYYDGLDSVAHAHGMSEHYDAELYTVDRMIRDLLAGMPEGSALMVTADHGHVEVGNRMLHIDEDIVEKCWSFSGEARFRWLHVHEWADTAEVLARCRERYSDLAWVKTRQEIIDEGWYGGPLSEEFASRLGEIALVPHAQVGFWEPKDDPSRSMVSRHGSLTAAEMYVPLLATLK